MLPLRPSVSHLKVPNSTPRAIVPLAVIHWCSVVAPAVAHWHGYFDANPGSSLSSDFTDVARIGFEAFTFGRNDARDTNLEGRALRCFICENLINRRCSRLQ